MIKKLFERIKEANTIRGTIEHYVVHFTTVDGEKHIFSRYKYGAPCMLSSYNIPQYIMVDVKSDGYLQDDNNVIYPLQNIISISWELDDVIENVPLKEYQVFYEKPIDKNPVE